MLQHSQSKTIRKISYHSEPHLCIIEVPNTSKKLFSTYVITCSAANSERSQRRRINSGLQYNMPTTAYESNYKDEGVLVDAPG